MTSKALSEILISQAKCERSENRLAVPDNVDVTLFASFGNESMTIARVASVEIGPELLVATTARKERYVLGFADVRALRFGSRGGSAGY